MINKKLFDYIKRSLERGQSQEKLINSLIHKGWSRNLIQNTIKQVLDGVELKYDLRKALKEQSRITFEKERFSILNDAQKNNSSRSSGILIIFISILIILLSFLWLSNSVVNIFNQEGFDFGKEMGELFYPTGYDREDSLKIKAEKEKAELVENKRIEAKTLESEELKEENIEKLSEVNVKETDLERLISEVEGLKEEHNLMPEEKLEESNISLDDIDEMTDEEILEELTNENIGKEKAYLRYRYLKPQEYCGWMTYEMISNVFEISACERLGELLLDKMICDQEKVTAYVEILDAPNMLETCSLEIYDLTNSFQIRSLTTDFSEYVSLLENQ